MHTFILGYTCTCSCSYNDKVCFFMYNTICLNIKIHIQYTHLNVHVHVYFKGIGSNLM